MRRTVDIFGISLPIAIISAIMLLFAYLGYITPFLLLLVIGAVFKITDEVLAVNTMKISLLYVFDMIFGVVLSLTSKIIVGFFSWLNDLVYDETDALTEFITGKSDNVLAKITEFFQDMFNFIGEAENIFFLVLLVIGAVSLIKHDAIKLPIADSILNKIIKKKDNAQVTE